MSGYDTRSAAQAEDLTRGPTPQTRHPDGALDEVKDTTQGPTPETRGTMRDTDAVPGASGQPMTDPTTRAGTADAPPPAPHANPSSHDAITRSEEELQVGTRQEEAGRATLRKTVETEHVTQTVPLEHEEAVITREPIADSHADAQIGEQSLDIDLTEEVVDVQKHVVPKERIRLDKDVEMEEREVSADLRTERVEVEHDPGLERR
jgi:uncharacterized protein (TIGR02271 family)